MRVVCWSALVSLCAALGMMLGSAAARSAEPLQKSAISGLVTMGRLNFVVNPAALPDNSLREANAHPGVYAGVVLLATWAQLEPSPGRYDFSAIEAGLNEVRAYNRRYRQTPIVAKLRVFGGPNAPLWAMQLDGGPLTLQEHDRSIQVGHFWSQPYRGAWRKLQQSLAARYDTDPLIQEVAVSSCASSTAEPFVVPLNTANVPTLVAAGYSDEAMERCLSGALDDYSDWRHVALDYTFNPWRTIASGRPRRATGFTESVMDDFRRQLGPRGVIANHGLTPTINPAAADIIAEMHRLGPPIEFQTRSPSLDWDAAIQTGEQVGVTEMEIWDTRDAGGYAPVTFSQLQHWRAELTEPNARR